MRYKVEVTIRLHSKYDELTVAADVESAVWDAMTDLINAERIDEASHVDVEAEPEDEPDLSE